MVTENIFKIYKPLFITFVDIETTFDKVNRTKLVKIMETIGIDYNNRKIIYNLYIGEILVIKTEKGNNQVEANITKGIKQRCYLLPTLFNIYIEREI